MANLSKPMLDLLIEHIDGAVVLVVKTGTLSARSENALRLRSIGDAMRKGLLVYVSRTIPTTTAMTEKGRQLLCAELAEMAEILLRAKFTADFMPPPGLALPSVSPDSERFAPSPAE